MSRLQISSSKLAEVSGVDHSLITKWRRGDRKLTVRSKSLRPVASALLEIDTGDVAKTLAYPFHIEGDSEESALAMYLVSEHVPGLHPAAKPVKRQTSGHYTVVHHVYLGKKGLRDALLSTLDYILTLPGNQTAYAVMHGNYNWLVDDADFARVVGEKVQQVFANGTRLVIVHREDPVITSVGILAAPWMRAHMTGDITSLYYHGDMPLGDSMVMGIKDYWSLRMREDPEVEDSIYVTMYTEPFDVRQDIKLCEQYCTLSEPVTQYGPMEEIVFTGPPDTCNGIYAIQRTISLGFIKQRELDEIAGGSVVVPELFVQPEYDCPNLPIRMILCVEDMQEALRKKRRLNKVLSQVLKRRVYVSSEILRKQLSRILHAMTMHEQFEVALVPRAAFEKIGLEMLALRDGVLFAWLEENMHAGYSEGKAMSEAMYYFGDCLWERLLAGWKRKSSVRRQLRKWLKGEELDDPPRETSAIRNWNMFD